MDTEETRSGEGESCSEPGWSLVYFFVHVLVKQGGCFTQDVDCYYTDSELSVVS